MKVCSTFHGFVLALREKVLENILCECSLVHASFRKNVYKPRQCHVYNVLLHEVGSVSLVRNTDFRRVL